MRHGLRLGHPDLFQCQAFEYGSYETVADEDVAIQATFADGGCGRTQEL